MKRVLLSLALATGAAHATQAQYSIPRPSAASPEVFHFPAVKSDTLSNGMRVLVVEDHNVQVVAVRVVIGVDELSDPVGKEGLYQVTLGALREGTKTRSPEQLADASAQLGVAISPTAFSATPSAFEGALGLMGDMLMNPSFDQAGIERRKLAQAATFRNAMARQALVTRSAWYNSLNGRDEAVSRSLSATEAGVKSITPSDVAAFYERHFGPRSTTLIVVGDLSHASALAAARKVFGGWRGDAMPVSVPTVVSAPRPTMIELFDAPGAATYIDVGGSGPERNAPDAFAAELLGTITTNRMAAALRERRALMYSGNMIMNWRPVPRTGEFLGATSVANAKADSALVEWIGVLRDLRAGTPSVEEVENAKRARVGPLWMRTDGADSVANRLSESVRDGLPVNFLERYAKGLEAVTPRDVAAAAMKYIDLDHLRIVVSGDRKVIEPALRATKLAPVVIIDPTGKPVP